MTRQLVLTADDLGRDAATNSRIAALAADGLITATTLITVSGHAEDALALIGDTALAPDVLVPHVHITLTSEGGLPPWRPLGKNAGSLVDATGAFHVDPFRLGAEGEPAHAVAEAGAQLDWMRQRGLRPVTADSHAGTLYGLHGRSFLAEALHWCAEEGLGFRLPRDPTLYLGGSPPAELARAHAAAVALADELGVRIPETIATNRRSAAELGSYEALRDGYLRTLDLLPDGTGELFLHPSRGLPGDVGMLRDWEARLLGDPVWLDAISAGGIRLVGSW